MHIDRLTVKAAVLAAGLATASLTALTTPAHAMPLDAAGSSTCVETGHDAAARGGWGKADTRHVSTAEQRAIAARTDKALRTRGLSATEAAATTASIPVYVHVMAGKNGEGDVSDAQIAAQIDVLNATYGGQESSAAADTGFTFHLAGTDRYYNNAWHQDRQSNRYRSMTRLGGANALNMWLVDFDYLGIATFPWDYDRHGSVDGIRVHWGSLPGGPIANYDDGETATHEAGHWLGLYHTFQGGCTETNDEVADTPAQDGPSSGCPEGRDSCPLPGTDPIHNYMDYSYDSCYDRFSTGQSDRMSQMWAAYRA